MSITYLFNNGCFTSKQPLFFALTFLILFSFGCEKVHEDNKVLFEVNGIEVEVYDFESKYVKHLIETGKNDTKYERYTFLNQMIDNLLLAEAATERGYLDDPIYMSAINFQQRKSMMDTYFVDEMDKIIEPSTDEEIRLAYAKKQRKVFVRHLFSMRETDLIEPYQRLKNGENFVDVANDFYSTAVYDSSAGYLGPISYFGVDDAFGDAAYSTNQGEYTEPIRSLFGYHIIYVEYIEFPGMLTEDDYQYRKAGVTSQLRLRKQQLVSNEYVRDLMGTLLVEADTDMILALKETIENLSSVQILNTTQNQEQQTDFWNNSKVDELAASFDRNAVLATYLLGGERVEFTFDDYLKWLPYLSLAESKTRTGASVGRGLRNEVLYQLAEKENYSRDDRVEKKVRERGYDVLSELYQRELIMDALRDTNSVEVPNSFRDRLVRNRQLRMEASYWKILAPTVNEAIKIKEDIVAGGIPESYDTYISYENKVVEPSDKDYTLVKDGLVGTAVVGNSVQEGWLVINVTEREISEISNSTRNNALQNRYKVFSNLNGTVEELREIAEIKVDTVLFNEIYDLYRDNDE